MTRIAPVRVCYNPRIYWFDALDFELSVDQKVVVQTTLGSELAVISNPPFEATDEQIRSLKSPLRPIVRIATEADIERSRELEQLGLEAMPTFRELAAQTNEAMRPVAVRYLLEGGKAIFYFEAEERIDFRDLVKRLASEFHVRVDMRQIGVRDEARMIGGLGHCGQELCCARMGGNFNPVSIRMAKEQDLSLNPQKISGSCGRLMCCLRYEYEVYKDVNSRAPKKNATIQTPEGPAKVVDMNVPRETVTLKLEGENAKTVKVLLSDFDPPEARTAEERPRPRSIGEEAWEAAAQREAANDRFEASFLTSQFTREDKVGSAQAVHHERGNRDSSSQEPSRGRSRSGRNSQKETVQAPDRKRRRRSTKIDAQGGRSDTVAADSGNGRERTGAVRPGQRSSGLSGRSAQSAAQGGRDGRKASKQRSAQGANAGGQGSANQRKKSGSAKSGKKDAGNDQRQRQRGRQADREQKQQQQQVQNSGKQQAQNGEAGSPHRRSRRRSHRANGEAGGASTAR